MSSFQKEYEVYYYQTDRNQEATPITILRFLEDTAIFHSESIGLGIDYLLEKRAGWVLNRWSLKMDRYPRIGEKVLIKTWPTSFERFYGTRLFSIQDREDNIIGKANSLWIYFNLDKRRPARIPADFAPKYGLIEESSIDLPFKELPEWVESDSHINFHVRKSDIDTNGHVNNVSYVEWMLEGIPQDLSIDYMLSELEVIYKKEITYGSDIRSESHKLKTHKQGIEEYNHRILSVEEGKELSLGRTLWRKR